MAGVRLPSGSFQDQSVAFQVWKYTRPIKDANGKGKFNGMLVFLFVDKRKIFVTKLSLEKFNTVFFTAELLACFEPTKQRSFGRNLRYILYSMVKESTFSKGNFCIYKGYIHVLYILTSAWKKAERKTTKCAPIWNWFYVEFCRVLSQFYLGEWSTIKLVLRELQSRINLWVFE